ncbi:hypothetical protein KPH14_002303 [Odynerus spinipes]|uniref:Prohormone-1 n=1 Tax=Odynerus spinipes TaxID=1348599 RepID=A0AAD9VQ00_9HYME|nr:hypothetical protein KPH14_002303 [Odynerus spinipes]
MIAAREFTGTHSTGRVAYFCWGKHQGRRKRKMSSVRNAIALTMFLIVLIGLTAALPTPDKDALLSDVDLVDDDGSINAALINYLFTKQIVKRLRNQLDISDLQRKRSYWKQCAFNAVSCFGK